MYAVLLFVSYYRWGLDEIVEVLIAATSRLACEKWTKKGQSAVHAVITENRARRVGERWQSGELQDPFLAVPKYDGTGGPGGTGLAVNAFMPSPAPSLWRFPGRLLSSVYGQDGWLPRLLLLRPYIVAFAALLFHRPREQ